MSTDANINAAPRRPRDSRADALAKANCRLDFKPPLSPHQRGVLAAIRLRFPGHSKETQRRRMVEAMSIMFGITAREAVDELAVTNPSDTIAELRKSGDVHVERVQYLDRDGQLRRTKLYTLAGVLA